MSYGNLLVLDYANGKLWILLSGVKGIRRLKEIHFDEPLRAQEALGISASVSPFTRKFNFQGDDVYVACFNRCEVRILSYLEGGVFTALNAAAVRSPSHAQRSASLPRPPESQV
ncbi:unnamed protein product [Cylicostephanus goldi]|uniref:Uncharacterized protein n=1 Tax=Cylicostephanus goldi TaxID=71465 RepID=A0A3P7PPR1_CYLGO|nr:unnamed protein product [Cylicostephanus goldi]